MRTLLLAAAATFTMTCAHAQEAIDDLIKTIAHSHGVMEATHRACGISQPVAYRVQLMNAIVKKKDGKFIAAAMRLMNEQEEAHAKSFPMGSCDPTTAALLRSSTSMLHSDLAELRRRLAD
ncbi:hypothetical protein [Bosea sp. RAC05]|uniref:hypothetical protein n=1 Tax=Bosea sp. RAC05 TaxID=1842539 RepID=UPI00083DA1DE|nr:hypothetical protein [Bosea sp. RAC05]AOG02801.1 hypothetical protein BSY19_4708 [Bosea sp. RAC05]